MSRETRIWVASLLMPLVLAVAGWINAKAEAVDNEELYDISYQAMQVVLSEHCDCGGE